MGVVVNVVNSCKWFVNKCEGKEAENGTSENLLSFQMKEVSDVGD